MGTPWTHECNDRFVSTTTVTDDRCATCGATRRYPSRASVTARDTEVTLDATDDDGVRWTAHVGAFGASVRRDGVRVTSADITVDQTRYVTVLLERAEAARRIVERG